MVMGDDSCSKCCGFKSWYPILDGHFFTLICCKNCIVCLKRQKINEKEAGVGLLHLKLLHRVGQNCCLPPSTGGI